MDEDNTGQQSRATIINLVEDHENTVQENPTMIKFLCSVNGDKAGELITYDSF
jgi:hypothetical protein